jgi:hypothetical protein
MKLFLLFAFISAPAFAGNAEEIAARVAQTYDPKIQTRLISSEWSFYGCRIENHEILGRDPVTGETRKVQVALYLTKTLSNKVVLILPPTGGVNILDKGYSNEFCSSGINAALVYGWDFQNQSRIDPQMHNEGALRSLAAAKHVVEFLSVKKFTRIGMLGTSIGAISGTLVLGFEPRIAASTLIVGSSKFADVIAESDESGARALRKKRMTEMGLKTLEEYRSFIKQHVWLDPALFLNKSMRARVFTITAEEDTTVPTKYQLDLNQEVNLAQHLSLRGDHTDVIKNMFFYERQRITDFFKAEL